LSQELFEGKINAANNASKSSVLPDDDEAQQIRIALQQHQWNRDIATKALGMGRTTLWRKMKKYNLMP